MKSLIEELRACAKMHPLDIDLDVLLEAADTLEDQARRIERLKEKAMKAHPSGVMLPERRVESPFENRGDLFTRGFNYCLDEVARSMLAAAPSEVSQKE